VSSFALMRSDIQAARPDAARLISHSRRALALKYFLLRIRTGTGNPSDGSAIHLSSVFQQMSQCGNTRPVGHSESALEERPVNPGSSLSINHTPLRPDCSGELLECRSF